MKFSLTVLTPLYNRKEYLGAMFESLNAQTRRDFQWLVIDDGSREKSETEIARFSEESGIYAEYHYKENGGKHTALNFSHQYIKSDHVLILDSDDTLTPDAVETVCKYAKKYSEDDSVGILCFQRGHDGSTPFMSFADGETVSDYIEYRINQNRPGDCAEVIKTEVLKKYPFPVFDGERFMDESHLWILSANEYKAVFIDRIIYICEYVEGGLTMQGRQLRLKNPHGAIHSQIVGLDKRCCLKFRIKKAMLLIHYGKVANLTLGEIRRKSHYPVFVGFMTLPGLFLHAYWTYKYGRGAK